MIDQSASQNGESSSTADSVFARHIDRLLAAGVNGFQIDSVYQDCFGLDPAE